MELAGFNIKVVIVAPGAIKSSIGDTGGKAITVSQSSAYKNVEDMIRYRAVYSQTGKPAPTPTDVFAREVVSKCTVKRPSAYLTTGSRSTIVKILYYLPMFVREWFLKRYFQMWRVGKGQ